jgi:hypothetical protein
MGWRVKRREKVKYVDNGVIKKMDKNQKIKEYIKS